jgi:hypothetical protein
MISGGAGNIAVALAPGAEGSCPLVACAGAAVIGGELRKLASRALHPGRIGAASQWRGAHLRPARLVPSQQMRSLSQDLGLCLATRGLKHLGSGQVAGLRSERFYGPYTSTSARLRGLVPRSCTRT